jgi:hypothetical protein
VKSGCRRVKKSLAATFAIFSKMLLWDCPHFIPAILHFCKKNGGCFFYLPSPF